MKKLSVISLSILLSFSIVSCYNSKNIKKENQIEAISSEQPIETFKEENIPEDNKSIKVRESTTFRNTIWGDSIDIVKENETDELVSEENINNKTVLTYKSFLLGNELYVSYIFDEDKLYQCIYSDIIATLSSEQYIQTYNSWQKSLIELYGEPSLNKIMKYKPDYMIEAWGEGTSLNLGQTAYISEWELQSTKIQLGLMKQNDKINLGIVYTDINYKEDLSKSGL